MTTSPSVFKARSVKFAPAPFVISAAPYIPPSVTPLVEGPPSAAPAPGAAEPSLEEARAEAARLARAAEEQAGAIWREAQAQGFESGRSEGRAAGEAEARELLLAARRVLEEARQWRSELLASSEPMILELVGDIAQKLFGEGLVLRREQLRNVVERALDHARSLGPARIRLHPEDVTTLQPQWPEDLPLVADETVERGGCIVEGAHGAVDGRVGVQLKRIKQTLHDAQTSVVTDSLTADH